MYSSFRIHGRKTCILFLLKIWPTSCQDFYSISSSGRIDLQLRHFRLCCSIFHVFLGNSISSSSHIPMTSKVGLQIDGRNCCDIPEVQLQISLQQELFSRLISYCSGTESPAFIDTANFLFSRCCTLCLSRCHALFTLRKVMPIKLDLNGSQPSLQVLRFWRWQAIQICGELLRVFSMIAN